VGSNDEPVLNRLLRRVDWRFVLPNPEPTRAVCFTSGMLARAVRLIAQSVADPHGSPRDCDLAVAVNPDAGTLAIAWRALIPGGNLYTEWTLPRLRRNSSLRSRLEGSGFENVALYWCWPPPCRGPALFWIPLENPGAISHFLTTRPSASGPVGRLLRFTMHSLWTLLYRAGVFPSVSAVATKPPARAVLTVDETRNARETGPLQVPSAASDTEHIQRMVLSYWQHKNGCTVPSPLSWTLLTGGSRTTNKVVALVFVRHEREPKLAIKMSRVPEATSALLREADALQQLHSNFPHGIPGVPEVQFLHRWNTTVAVAETALTGLPLLARLRPDSYRDIALMATKWLASLADHAAPTPRAEWWDRLIEPILTDFAHSFGPLLDSASMGRLRERLSYLDALPLVCEQRDFSPWNLLIDPRGALVVLDWESAELGGLPSLDLHYFLTYLAFFHDGALESGQLLESYRAAADPSTFTGRIQHECLDLYCNRLRLNPATLGPLRILTWLVHSRSEYQRLKADADGRPDGATMQSSLFLTLIREELLRGK
jgi:hypothetical protein